MERKDFGFTYNVRGYMIKYKGINIGGAGIAPDARGPHGGGVAVQLGQYQKEAEITIQGILSGNPGRHYALEVGRIDEELKVGGWSGTIWFDDLGQDFTRWIVKDGQVISSEPLQTWVWEGSIVKNSVIAKGDILFVTLPTGLRTTMRYPVEKAEQKI